MLALLDVRFSSMESGFCDRPKHRIKPEVLDGRCRALAHVRDTASSVERVLSQRSSVKRVETGVGSGGDGFELETQRC